MNPPFCEAYEQLCELFCLGFAQECAWFFFFSFLVHCLTFCSDGGLELIDRPVVLQSRPVHGRGRQFGIGVGIEAHHLFGAVRRIGVFERHCGCPFLEREHTFQSFDVECHNLRSFEVELVVAVTWTRGSPDIRHTPPAGMTAGHRNSTGLSARAYRGRTA